MEDIRLSERDKLFDEKYVRITTSIPSDAKRFIKARKYKYSTLIMIGLRVAEKNDGVVNMQQSIDDLIRRNNNLRQELMKIL